MKKLHKKGLVLLAALALLLTCAVSGTVAYLSASSGPVTNTFTPVQVDTVIEEAFSEDGGKTSIKVYNKAEPENIPVYVRVAIFGNWVKDGKIVAPWEGSWKGVANIDGESWTYQGGYYYYTKELGVGERTDEMLKSPITAGTPPVDGAHLELTVLHQSIQTTPASALTDAKWGWTPPASAQ